MMNKIFGIITLLVILCTTVIAAECDKYTPKKEMRHTCKFDFGFKLFKDPYSGVFYIYDITDNSPAMREGLKIGDEVLTINETTKLKKYSQNLITTMLGGMHSATLEIKDSNNNKKNVEITKTNMCSKTIVDDKLFETYWHKIYKNNTEMDDLISKNNKLLKIGLSTKAKQDVLTELNELMIWDSKRNDFKIKYNSCIQSFSKNQLPYCLNQIVNNMTNK